jgi:hypothetical protein
VNDDFKLLMLGAMYENGGNTTQRFLDGHPQLFVYPYESQLGSRLVVDHLSSLFPNKYRWPVFALDASPADDFLAFIDEEARVRSRTPHVSKFRDHPFEMSDIERGEIYVRQIARTGRSRPNNVAAFFVATFDAWKDCRKSGREEWYVGYSPILVVDADKILTELPRAHFLHVVRNPWSAYADTKKRPVPLPLSTYLFGWTINQYFAILYQRMFPERMHILRFEDLIADPGATLAVLCDQLGIAVADSLDRLSWNGQLLSEVYPWGTIRTPTVAANRATARELSPSERNEITARARPYLEEFGYTDFI